MSDEWPLFESPDEHKLGRHADLIHRAQLVSRDGWGRDRHLWSCGEVIGTALVLGDDASSSAAARPGTARWSGGHSIYGE